MAFFSKKCKYLEEMEMERNLHSSLTQNSLDSSVHKMIASKAKKYLSINGKNTLKY